MVPHLRNRLAEAFRQYAISQLSTDTDSNPVTCWLGGVAAGRSLSHRGLGLVLEPLLGLGGGRYGRPHPLSMGEVAASCECDAQHQKRRRGKPRNEPQSHHNDCAEKQCPRIV